MKKSLYALILLVLCLAVPAVNAVSITLYSNGDTTNHDNYKSFNLGTITSTDLSVIGPNTQMVSFSNLVSCSVVSASGGTSVLSLSNSSSSASFIVAYVDYSAQFRINYVVSVSYNYEGLPPEPDGPYLSATVLSESTTGITYQIKPMPDDGTYLFSKVNTGNPSAVDSTIIYSSEDAAINYIIGRGLSQTFYCNYKEGYWGLPHTMSITLSGPVFSEDVLINASIINATLQDMPNPIRPNSNPTTNNNNPLVSGSWRAIGRDAVVSSAFGDIVRNGGIVFSLPHMASPEELRAGLLNNTGNITAPLYDYIDSASGMVLFLPDILANAVGTVLNGISETVSIIKTYIDYIFGLLDNCMDFFYILLPIVYVLIPDAVWWCFSALLCYFIIKWILILILGYDVISAYLTDSKGDDKK